MIHEHEQLEIASAGMDFPLDPAVEHELRRRLAECPICAERADAYHAQMRLMARLPVVDASERTRRRVTAAAVTGQTGTRSPMLLLLAAALLLAGALATTAVVGALLNERQPADLGMVDVSPSTAPASVVVVGAATPSALPAPTPKATIVLIDDALPAGALLDVVTSNLRVRSEPRVADDSDLLEPFLQAGDRLAVVEGPVIASDYAWFRVIPVSSGSAGRTADDLPTGWVATGDHEGNPWVSAAEPVCPDGSVDIDALVEMHRFERLACFEDQALTFLALLEGDPEIGWRAVDQLIAAASTSPIELAPVADAPFALTDIPHGHGVVLSGAFDRPGDFACEALPIDDAALAELNCRSTFVLTSATRGPYQADVGSPAVTVTDNLRVRSAPEVSDQSVKLELLADGTGVVILDGPVVRSGYLWYQVAVPSMRTSSGGMVGGWVAVGSRTGGEWLDHDGTPCPPSPELSFDQFAALVSGTAVHRLLPCLDRDGLGSGPVTVDGRMRLECSGAAAEPGWLSRPPYSLILTPLDGGPREIATFAADATFGLTCGAPASDLHYRLIGHFGDSSAESCRAETSGADVEQELADRLAVLDCRLKFVVEGGSVTGPGPTPQPTAPPAP